jgi:hypothetical protein
MSCSYDDTTDDDGHLARGYRNCRLRGALRCPALSHLSPTSRSHDEPYDRATGARLGLPLAPAAELSLRPNTQRSCWIDGPV